MAEYLLCKQKVSSSNLDVSIFNIPIMNLITPLIKRFYSKLEDLKILIILHQFLLLITICYSILYQFYTWDIYITFLIFLPIILVSWVIVFSRIEILLGILLSFLHFVYFLHFPCPFILQLLFAISIIPVIRLFSDSIFPKMTKISYIAWIISSIFVSVTLSFYLYLGIYHEIYFSPDFSMSSLFMGNDTFCMPMNDVAKDVGEGYSGSINRVSLNVRYGWEVVR